METIRYSIFNTTINIENFITNIKSVIFKIETYMSDEVANYHDEYEKKTLLFYLRFYESFKTKSNKKIINLLNFLSSINLLERGNKQIQKINNNNDKALVRVNYKSSLCYDRTAILSNIIKRLDYIYLNNKIFFGRVCRIMKEHAYDEKNNIFRILRIGFDLSADELAKEINISRSYIFAIENGTKKPSDKVLDLYSNYFGINKDALLDLMSESKNSTFQKILFKILKLIIE